MTKDPTLYLDKENYNVYTTRVDKFKDYESFIPSLDFQDGETGYVVCAIYTTYDSENTWEDESFEIIDAYKSKNHAKGTAQAIVDHYKADRDAHRIYPTAIVPDLILTRADGSPYGRGYHNFPWMGWGQNFKRVAVAEFQLAEDPKIMIFGVD